jgi:hypothetical protein
VGGECNATTKQRASCTAHFDRPLDTRLAGLLLLRGSGGGGGGGGRGGAIALSLLRSAARQVAVLLAQEDVRLQRRRSLLLGSIRVTASTPSPARGVETSSLAWCRNGSLGESKEGVLGRVLLLCVASKRGECA